MEFLADAGIRQFLDLGTGLPSQNNVHEVAQRVRPDARVVYVDNDPIVLAHARALLSTDDSTAVIGEDMRQPERILAHPTVQRWRSDELERTRPGGEWLLAGVGRKPQP